MGDMKKLHEEELVQVNGGDGGTESKEAVIINQNGTDLCGDPFLRHIKKHLKYGINVKYSSKGNCSTYVWLDSGDYGYVNSNDIIKTM